MRAASAAAAAVAVAVAAVVVPAARPAPLRRAPAAYGQTWIAHLVAPVAARTSPSGRIVSRIAALAPWNHGPVGLLVLAERTGADGRRWLQIRLPDRPNGGSAWIPSNRTRLATTPWRIEVSLGKRTVTLERKGAPVRVFRAVIGAAGTPTPTGLFAVSERISQPNPHGFYGPWVLLLTAYSSTLFYFDGGPGQISIHGRDGTSLRDPLGTARSHGCIRIDNAGIDLLARVAAEGTPVTITA